MYKRQLKWCGRSDNIATRIIRQPGIWVQHLTVFEPDDSMIEVDKCLVGDMGYSDGHPLFGRSRLSGAEGGASTEL